MYGSRQTRGGGGILSRWCSPVWWYTRLSAVRPRTWAILLSSVFMFLVLMNLAFYLFPDSTSASLQSLQSYLPSLRSALPAAALFKPPTQPAAINAAPPVPPTPTATPNASPLSPLLNQPPQPPQPPPNSPLTLNATSISQWQSPASSYCDRQFGNGFTETAQLCITNSAASTSSLTCHYNPLTVSTICDGKNIRIHNARIEVSRGDEEISSVRHRKEEAEFPSYSSGAFALDCLQPQPPPDLSHTMYRDHLAGMFKSIEYGPGGGGGGGGKCDEEVGEAVVITRYEYANLYHTMTDVYNTYQALQMYGQSSTHPLVLFMDGHSKGAMDSLWPTLFSSNVRYIKHMPATLCIRHAIFVSPGYGSALTPAMFTAQSAACTHHPLVMDFAAFVQRKYRLGQEDSNEKVVVKDITGTAVELAGSDDAHPLVSFIVRRSYLSHPRVRLDATERTMRDELPTLKAVQDALAAYAVRFHAFDFTQLPLHTQLNVLYHSSLLTGLHGAALSYILVLPQRVSLVELLPTDYAVRQHFRFFATWSSHAYKALPVSGAGGGDGYEVNKDALVSAVVELVGGGKMDAAAGGGDSEGDGDEKRGGKKGIEFSKIVKPGQARTDKPPPQSLKFGGKQHAT